VHLGLVDPSPRALDATAPRARAAVLLEARADAAIDDAAIRALVAGAVPELTPDDVAVVRAPARAVRGREPQLVTLGPVTVTRSTEGALKAILAGSFVLNLALIAALLFVRRRAARRT
jgi:type III secretory pathway lipoprotein EscJ